jgi:hypothetical protein
MGFVVHPLRRSFIFSPPSLDLFKCFLYVFFSMSDRYWLLLPSASCPLEYILLSSSRVIVFCSFFLILVIVLLLYVHLCIHSPTETEFIHVSPTPFTTRPQHSSRNNCLSATLPSLITFSRIYVVTLIVSAFSSAPCVYRASSININPFVYTIVTDRRCNFLANTSVSVWGHSSFWKIKILANCHPRITLRPSTPKPS